MKSSNLNQPLKRLNRLPWHWMPALVGFALWPSALAHGQVSGYLEGTVTISAAIDTVKDYSGIQVFVTTAPERGRPDTLGYAVTDVEGRFSTAIKAPMSGVYPLLLARRGTIVYSGEYVVADGDSASMAAELPLGERPPRIRSIENSAWIAFKNTEAQHRALILELVQEGNASSTAIAQTVELTSGVHWKLQEAFPGTIGARIAAAKAVTMLEGWNDSLLVVRALELPTDNPGYVEVLQSARRAEARNAGVPAAIEFLRSAIERTSEPELDATIRAEIVQTYVDANKPDSAVAAIESLLASDPDSVWVVWAERARYEAQYLMPGNPVPLFELMTADSVRITTDSLRGSVVVLEFWTPRDQRSDDQYEAAATLYRNHEADGLQWISIAFETSPTVFETFLEGRDVFGWQSRSGPARMQQLAGAFNVDVLPTRFLIDRGGRFVKRFEGHRLFEVEQSIERLLSSGEGS